MLKYMIENGGDRINSIPGALTQEANTCITGTGNEDSEYNKDLECEEVLKFDTKRGGQFRLEKSSSSFKFEDLEGFIYGPITSRFWMLRKLILSLEHKMVKQDAPFFAWDCITLQVRGRPDIYIVIRNEKIMSMFIKLLIYKMKTIDGTRGSMDVFIDNILKKESKFRPNLTKIDKYEIRVKIRNQLV